MSKEGEGMIDDGKKENPDNEPQPIELKATFYPDGRLHIECPFMSDPMRMLGFLDVIKDATKAIMNRPPEKPRIQPGGFLGGLRRMGH